MLPASVLVLLLVVDGGQRLANDWLEGGHRMELKDTLRSISNDARGWLKAWAGDFTEAEASLPVGDGRAPNPLAWQLGHLACTEEDVAALFGVGAPPEPMVPVSLRAV
ncbi:MAG TPA: hypothetical protein VFT28_08600, partial [Gemmatimonadales bacterium]|nr:hypothetical protein [Gemmatimonadales bacterium]